MGSRRPVIIAIACTVVGSILAGLAVWFFYGRPQVLGTTDTESAIATTKGASTAKRARGRSDVIATFAGKPISRAEYEAAWTKELEDNEVEERKIPPQAYLPQRFAALLQLVDQRIYESAFAEYGLTLDEAGLQERAESAARGEAFRRHGGEQELNYFLQARGITMDAYIKEIATEALSRDRDGLERRVKMFMVDEKTTEDVRVGEEDLPKYLRVAEVQRIAQLYDPSGKPAERVSEDDAKAKIEEAYTKLQGGASFDELIAQYSNGPERTNSGKLEPVPYGVDKQFDDEVWTIKEGQYTKPFHGERGWHIIKVLRFRQEAVPTDPQQKKAAMAQIEEQLRQARVTQWLDERQKAGKLEVNDADLAGYQALADGRYDEAAKLFEEALQSADPGARTPIQVCLANAQWRLGNVEKAEAILAEVIGSASEEDKPALLVERANFYLNSDREEQALQDLEEAGRLAPGDAERVQIAMLYVQINHPDKAQALLLSIAQSSKEPGVLAELCQIAAAHKWQNVGDAAQKALLDWIATAQVDDIRLLERMAQSAAEVGWSVVADACVARLKALTAELAAQAESVAPAPAAGESQPR